MNFIVSIIHVVVDVEQAADFLIDVLNFQERSRTQDSVQVDNGALSVRLVTTGIMARAKTTLELEMSTEDLPAAAQHYQAIAGVEILTEPQRLSQEQLEMRLQGPQNIIITLSKTFDEDELAILLPLPTSLDWHEDAEIAVQRLLRIVPLGFREQARQRVTEQAEMAAAYNGEVTVDQLTAIRSLAQATPTFQHQALREALAVEGLNTDVELVESD